MSTPPPPPVPPPPHPHRQTSSSSAMTRSLAQETVAWYIDQIDPMESHAYNVQQYLRNPATALTASILAPPAPLCSNPSSAAAAIINNNNNEKRTGPPLNNEATTAAKKKSPEKITGSSANKKQDSTTTTTTAKKQDATTKNAGAAASDWRDYLNLAEGSSLDELFASSNNNHGNSNNSNNNKTKIDYESLSGRAKARLEAFLEGVSLAVVSMNSNKMSGGETPEIPPPNRNAFNHDNRALSNASAGSLSLIEGLVGFRTLEQSSSSGGGTATGGLPLLLQKKDKAKSHLQQHRSSIRGGSIKVVKPCPQLAENELVTRLDLYLRSLHRVISQGCDCVVAHEPPKALKARTRCVVSAFVDTVGTVRNVNSVLTKLLTTLTKELLAVRILSDNITNIIRNIVSGYVHSTSFASLAFLSSPETSADRLLAPTVLKFLLYLQKNWEKCEAECENEIFLSTVLDQEMRHTFKTSEFQSIGHLLEVCRVYRDELQNIKLSPTREVVVDPEKETEEDRVYQAIKDVQREVIAVNGSVLPHVANRSDLIQLLASALNNRNIFEGPRRRGKKKKKKRSGASGGEESDTFFSSGNEAESETSYRSGSSTSEVDTSGATTRRRHRSKFRLATVDLLTKRLLLAASRTGPGGDAYFVVRDLFGGEDVEVVPSTHPVGSVRPATIDLLVRLASVTIKCHGSFDVYPKSLVGDCEPLIQIHTTTTETIGLREVRAADGSTAEDGSVIVLQERQTEGSGHRILSVRPALYEKVSVWNTPS